MKNPAPISTNNKGLAGQLIIFIVLVAITSGFIFFVYLTGNQIAAEVYFNDDLRSVSLISSAVINSPNCLLHTDKDTLFQPPRVISNKGTIDWDKISDSKKACVKKGPYIWNVTVADNELKETRGIQSFDSSSCAEIGGRSLPVLIKRGADLNSGKATVYIASKDALASFTQKADDLTIIIKNSGSCSSNFKFTLTVINETSGEQVSGFDVVCNGYETGNLEREKIATVACKIPQGLLPDYGIKVEISPDGMEYYSKEYRIKP